jgi:hypothetical protein
MRNEMQSPETHGADLLSELHAALTRYVVLPSPEAADAVVLWIAATHGQPAFEHAPRLSVTAPEKRCGKSRLLDIISATCHAPLVTVNATVAAIFRSIGDDPPTLIIDEADTIFGEKTAANHEDLRALLNAGHQRGRPTIRCHGSNQDVKEFPTFAMAALAGIGSLPDTITDRAVVIPMRRRANGETVQPYRRRRDEVPLNDLRDRLREWVRDNIDKLAVAVPASSLEDRAADTWEPLLAVAELAGGDWPERARKAAEALTATAVEQDATAKLSTQLLSDLRDIFGDKEAMHGETIVDALHAVDDAPWSSYYGRVFNANDLAAKLRPYNVRSRDVKINGVNRKGYRRDDFWDTWTRYLPAAKNDATGATGATEQVNPVAAHNSGTDASATGATAQVSGQAASDATPPEVAEVAEVAPSVSADRALTLDVAPVAPVAPSQTMPMGATPCADCGRPNFNPASPLCATCIADSVDAA